MFVRHPQNLFIQKACSCAIRYQTQNLFFYQIQGCLVYGTYPPLISVAAVRESCDEAGAVAPAACFEPAWDSG